MSVWTIIDNTWQQTPVWEQVLALFLFAFWGHTRAKQKKKEMTDLAASAQKIEQILEGQRRLYETTRTYLRQIDEAVRPDDPYWIRQRRLRVEQPDAAERGRLEATYLLPGDSPPGFWTTGSLPGTA